MRLPSIGVSAGFHHNTFTLLPAIQLQVFEDDEAHGLAILFQLFSVFAILYIGWAEDDAPDEVEVDGK